MSDAAPAAEDAAPRLPVRAIFLLALATFAAVACIRATDPLLDLIAHEFGVSGGSASIIVTVFGLAYGLTQVFYGPLGDRIGKYRLVFITCALTTIGSFGCAFATSLEQLAAARLLTGATAGALFPMSIAWISDIVPYERRQALLARFVVSNFLGSALGAIAAGLMAEWFGWRSMFVLLGCLFLGIAAALYWELRRNPATRHTPDAQSTLADAFGQIRTYLSDARARDFLALIALESALMLSPVVFIPLHGQREFGLSPSASAVLMVSVLLGGMVYLAAAGILTRRVEKRTMVMVGGALSSLTMLGMVVAPGIASALPLLLLFGFGSTMMHNTFMVRATEFSPKARGVSVTLFSSCQYVSTALGVWAEGALLDVAGTGALFALCAVGLPSALFFFIRRMRAHGPPAAP